MTLNEALAALASSPVGSFIARPGGPTVRLASGNFEHALHRYVVDLPEELREYEGDTGARAFEATEADHWEKAPIREIGQDMVPGSLRKDWALTKRDARAIAQKAAAKEAEATAAKKAASK